METYEKLVLDVILFEDMGVITESCTVQCPEEMPDLENP